MSVLPREPDERMDLITMTLELEEAHRQIERLRVALEKYGRHAYGPSMADRCEYANAEHYTCGLRESMR